MGKPTGFLEYQRRTLIDRPPSERLADFSEFHVHLSEQERRQQGSRCMDCGVPFCQSGYGCPVDNLIPEWNDLVYRGRWEEAFRRLLATNNFPEYTGRVCPAPCETACVLGINAPPVTIKDNEVTIIDRAYATGLMGPRPPASRTGARVAVVGSGPAGLAAADELNRAGHSVTVYEQADRIGGLLMYGIPNMKLDKGVVERRNAIMAAEGVEFRTGCRVGTDLDPEELLAGCDAMLLACGATVPRDLAVSRRDLGGIHFAMDYLTASTRALLDGHGEPPITARGRKVVVIGGGDTGNDCIGTAMRQGCASLVNFELLPRPPAERTRHSPWPTYPRLLRQDYGHEEAAAVFGSDPREYGILTREFLSDGRNGVSGIRTIRIEWFTQEDGRQGYREVPGSEQEWEADLVLLALGFLGPDPAIPETLGLERDGRSNLLVRPGSFATSRGKVFAAGDARRGQSLVVWAIKEGRLAAHEIDRCLTGGDAAGSAGPF